MFIVFPFYQNSDCVWQCHFIAFDRQAMTICLLFDHKQLDQITFIQMTCEQSNEKLRYYRIEYMIAREAVHFAI